MAKNSYTTAVHKQRVLASSKVGSYMNDSNIQIVRTESPNDFSSIQKRISQVLFCSDCLTLCYVDIHRCAQQFQLDDLDEIINAIKSCLDMNQC